MKSKIIKIVNYIDNNKELKTAIDITEEIAKNRISRCCCAGIWNGASSVRR